MPLLIVPYTLGSEMGVATTPLGGGAYYLKRQSWWMAICVLLLLAH